LIKLQKVSKASLHQLAQILIAVAANDFHSLVQDEIQLGLKLQQGILISILWAGKFDLFIVTHQFFYTLLFSPWKRKLFQIGVSTREYRNIRKLRGRV